MVTSYYSLVAPGAVFGFFTYVMIWSALFHGGYEMEKGFVIGQQVLDDHIKVDQGRPVYSAKARYYLLLADAKKPGKTCWVKVTSTEYFQVQGVLAIMGRYYYDPDDDRRFIDQQQS
ncbi:MAG TPA: hypothetical protein VLF91_05700 [Candidatus Saccharimonadales bacterium]|nr:hypothetical protein [Candidatus Saccharimonadales bacterium]